VLRRHEVALNSANKTRGRRVVAPRLGVSFPKLNHSSEIVNAVRQLMRLTGMADESLR
jgi:hypothetical protein